MIGIGDNVADLKKRGVYVDIHKVLPDPVLRRLEGEYPSLIPRVYAEAGYVLLDADLHPIRTIADVVFVVFEIGNMKFIIGPCKYLEACKDERAVAMTIYDFNGDGEKVLAGYDHEMELLWVE